MVLIILGVLAATIVPRYADLRDVAKQKAAESAVAEGMSRWSLQYAQHLLQGDGRAPAPSQAIMETILGVSQGTKVNIGDYYIDYTYGSGSGGIPVVRVRAYDSSTAPDAISEANATWPEL